MDSKKQSFPASVAAAAGRKMFRSRAEPMAVRDMNLRVSVGEQMAWVAVKAISAPCTFCGDAGFSALAWFHDEAEGAAHELKSLKG